MEGLLSAVQVVEGFAAGVHILPATEKAGSEAVSVRAEGVIVAPA